MYIYIYIYNEKKHSYLFAINISPSFTEALFRSFVQKLSFTGIDKASVKDSKIIKPK